MRQRQIEDLKRELELELEYGGSLFMKPRGKPNPTSEQRARFEKTKGVASNTRHMPWRPAKVSK